MQALTTEQAILRGMIRCLAKNEQWSNRGQFEELSRHSPGGMEEKYKNFTVWQASLECYAGLLSVTLSTVKPRSIVPGYIVFPDPSFNFCGP
jgi:hypothetical protein